MKKKREENVLNSLFQKSYYDMYSVLNTTDDAQTVFMSFHKAFIHE